MRFSLSWLPLACASAILLPACGSDKATEPAKATEQSKVTPTPAPPVPPEFKMPRVTYPAAVIFEGGEGDVVGLLNSTNHRAAWRLTLCLEKTESPVTREVHLDFTQLGHPYVLEAFGSDAHGNSTTDRIRLNGVDLVYTYTTKLHDTPEKDYGYAYGLADIEMKGRQNWVPLTKMSKRELATLGNTPFFDLKSSGGLLAQASTMSYKVEGKSYYMASSFERFTFSEKDARADVIELCEKARQPYVLQTGSEIAQ